MMTEKTTSNSFAHGFLANPKNALLFVGYAAPETPAGVIRVSKQGDIIELSPDLTPVQFNCSMKIFDFSGHSDRETLLNYMLKVAPRKMFLVHGDINASKWFRDQLKEKLPDCDVIIPVPKEIYDLDL
jgi:predicted metal-dependent RNase